MKYRIKITYNTGDSFHTEEGVVSYLEEDFTDLKVAEENINRIKEHHEYNEANADLNRKWYFGDQNKKKRLELTVNNAKNKPWYVEKYPDMAIKLLLNDGKVWQISAFWHGNFEHLVSVEIEGNFPKFTFHF